MKYQLLNGWTPHKIFESVKASGRYLAFWWTKGIGNAPFKELPVLIELREAAYTPPTEESVARWLVANTEGDW